MSSSPQRRRIAIAGLGVLGGSTALHLARRGAEVIGFDRHRPPHRLGSSHGRTRIIREAYFEDPAYVPLVQRARTLWDSLQQESNRTLLCQTGALMLGQPSSELIRGACLSAERHGLPHELLDAEAVTRRYPSLAPGPEMVGLWEPRAGVLFAEACIEAQLALCAERGASLHLDEGLLDWQASAHGVSLTTARGRYTADCLVLALGSRLPELLGRRSGLWVERQVQYWFEVRREAALPVHLWQLEDGRFFYGFPIDHHGLKVAMHHGGEQTDADSVRRHHDVRELAEIRSLLERLLPGVAGELRTSEVCLYTNTPDGHFWIDQHPSHPNVFIASACSGHGFKFASALGEALAEWILVGEPTKGLEPFRNRSTLGLDSV